MSCQLYFVKEDIRLEVPAHTSLLQAQRMAGLLPDAPCGGMGTCGKCLVEICPAGSNVWKQVKSCATEVTCALDIRTLSKLEARVLTQGEVLPAGWDPMVQLVALQVPPCKKGESSADWSRLMAALEQATGRRDWQSDLQLAARLGSLLKASKGTVWAAVCQQQVLDVWDHPAQVYMAAFDIGTTTLAGYLLDGQGIRARAGMPNPQARYGADVIARADYAVKNSLQELTGCVRQALDELLGQLCGQAGIQRTDVLAVSAVGNTCMHHLFLGISPASLVTVPYNPAFSDGVILPCRDYGIRAHSAAPLLVLPVIAGFVGADTAGCLVAGNWAQREQLTLLIDIGTNGELVLGNRQRRIACSTAAGPAFEGALISCGMRGAPGAVDHVWLEQGKICHSVIGGGPARGICGSGLIDFIAVLRQLEIIDSSGALRGSAALPGTELALTKKDIRQVQLAKAAISAGIQLMVRRLGVELEDIAQVCIAGAFGTYMNGNSACDIGLIPQQLRHKLRSIGNAAGAGAVLVLQQRDAWAGVDRLARQTEFLELATIADFQDTFVDELEFPEMT